MSDTDATTTSRCRCTEAAMLTHHERLLASAMRKVLTSEDMYVDPMGDRLLLDGHVHGGLSADEMAAVRRVLAAFHPDVLAEYRED